MKMRKMTEKNERVWLPILAVMMVWAMALIGGCGSGGGGDTTNNTYNTYYNYSSGFNNNSTFNNTSTVFGNNSTVATAITIVSPNGGETLMRGGNMSASWSLAADQNYSLFFFLIPQGTITISGPTYFNPDAGGYSMGAYSPTAIETSGNWTVAIPTDIDASVPYKLKIYMNKAGSGGIFNLSDVLMSDEADTEFTIN